jgi:hypothetical protein
MRLASRHRYLLPTGPVLRRPVEITETKRSLTNFCASTSNYEYAPFCNGPGEVKSPELSSRRRVHASVRGQR